MIGTIKNIFLYETLLYPKLLRTAFNREHFNQVQNYSLALCAILGNTRLPSGQKSMADKTWKTPVYINYAMISRFIVFVSFREIFFP